VLKPSKIGLDLELHSAAMATAVVSVYGQAETLRLIRLE